MVGSSGLLFEEKINGEKNWEKLRDMGKGLRVKYASRTLGVVWGPVIGR